MGMAFMGERHTVQINTHVSDIFFNMDHSEAEITDSDGHYVRHDPDALLRSALMLRDALAGLGVDAGEPTDIVNDFIARL